MNFNFYIPLNVYNNFPTDFFSFYFPHVKYIYRYIWRQVPENEKYFDLKPKFNIVFVTWYSFDSFCMLFIWYIYIHFTIYIHFHVWIITYISEECYFCVYTRIKSKRYKHVIWALFFRGWKIMMEKNVICAKIMKYDKTV